MAARASLGDVFGAARASLGDVFGSHTATSLSSVEIRRRWEPRGDTKICKPGKISRMLFKYHEIVSNFAKNTEI